MAGPANEVRVRHGLGVMALLAFVASFLSARAFTTISPATVVVSSGIHFHHFWYGLAMVVAAGWLGIAYNRPSLDRVYAVLFGLGGGLIGDEIGLLLTLGNYQSELTFVFFVGAVSIATAAILFRRYEGEVRREIMVDRGEGTALVGVMISGFSAVAFAAGIPALGLLLLFGGGVVMTFGYWQHASQWRRKHAE
jgi:hypothetical protein